MRGLLFFTLIIMHVALNSSCRRLANHSDNSTNGTREESDTVCAKNSIVSDSMNVSNISTGPDSSNYYREISWIEKIHEPFGRDSARLPDYVMGQTYVADFMYDISEYDSLFLYIPDNYEMEWDIPDRLQGLPNRIRFTRDSVYTDLLNYCAATFDWYDQGKRHTRRWLADSYQINPANGNIRLKHSLWQQRHPDYRFYLYEIVSEKIIKIRIVFPENVTNKTYGNPVYAEIFYRTAPAANVQDTCYHSVEEAKDHIYWKNDRFYVPSMFE